jgi:hypothetical protein
LPASQPKAFKNQSQCQHPPCCIGIIAAPHRLAKIRRNEIIARDCQSCRYKNLPNHFRSEENHESEDLQSPAESEVNAAGVRTQSDRDHDR